MMSGSGGNFVNLRGVGLSNTVHSEVAPCLPLPSLPVFCGAADQELRLFDEPSRRSLNRSDVVEQASKIADLLGNTDVSYLDLRDVTSLPSECLAEPLDLYNEVLRCNSNAFAYNDPGRIKEKISNTVPEKKIFEKDFRITRQSQEDYEGTNNHYFVHDNDISSSARKSKVKRKKNDNISSSVKTDPSLLQDSAVEDFCEKLVDFCGKAEIQSDDRDEAEWLPVSLNDLRMLVNEITSICSKKVLHLVPLDYLLRLLRVLDHQVHRAEGLSIDEYEHEHSDSDGVSTVFSALESIHAALAVMTYKDMPKNLYKEEIIERILEFSRHQMMEVMSAFDPSLHKPSGVHNAEEDEEADMDIESATKRRRNSRSAKVKKSSTNKVSTAVHAIFQKLCTILVLLKDLLLVERLSDSCILQLVKTSFTTFSVDNIHLLQLKAIVLISGIFYSYTQHRTYVIDETVQLLCKAPFSKRALRAYHLPDEEQRQIHMITALLIQIVHCSANLPDVLRQVSTGVPILEGSINAGYLSKCHEAVTDTCAMFWSRVLQRFASVGTQDAAELRIMMENLVMDLLTTLNLPEYPASAHILEVLCVLLLQNYGVKSKDTSVRCMAIDLLGSIATRLKHDAFLFRNDRFWMIQELVAGNNTDHNYPKDACSICLDGRVDKSLYVCQGCHRVFHADCMGVREHCVPNRGWYCQFCLCRNQLLVLQSYCKSQRRDDAKSHDTSEEANIIIKIEIVQQMLLNYLRNTDSVDDMNLFSLWFYLCMWFKDDLKSQEKYDYYLARFQSKTILRDSGIVSTLTRDSVKKITQSLAQNCSFSRGFDKILRRLLASLNENSPIIRAKALRAVSIIVEADPEVLCEERVQSAVEGRFCDSAISVREAALELVGRHIASHPDVGLKYFEKVAERIKDTGVSVRKRSIKIIRDMCTSNNNFSEFTGACTEIISRVTDEESSVQDLVCKTFYEFWFEEPSTSRTQFYGDSSPVPLEVAKKTEQIVEMLRRMSNHQLLVTIIKRNLALDFFPQSAKVVGINPMLISSVRKRCELMCKYLLERILQMEEMNRVEVESRTLPYVLALHAFCVVDPMLCAPTSDPSQFVVTLQPYLKSQVENRVVAQLLESIIFVIDAVLPLVRKLPQTVIKELEQDLKHMIVRHSFLTVVNACIKCLCSVSKVAGKGASVVEYLIQVFLKSLDSLGLDNKQQVGRSLFCLGVLIRYGSSLLSSSGKNIDVTSSLVLFKHYLSVDDFIIKVRSLQALGFVLIARPEYMLAKDVVNILEAALSSGSDFRLKIQALQNMYEYLVNAENQMGTDITSDNAVHYSVVDDNDPVGGNSVPVAAGAGDTNICGGIVQLYWDYILGRCLDGNEHVRQSALKIVEVVLRQGLVHPITCVPYLVALETDPQEVNSKLAHHLLMNMNEKYPAFIETRLGDGLQMSFVFIQSMTGSAPENSNPRGHSKAPINMKGKSEGDSFVYARLGVSRIYKLLRGNRVSRNKFMSSVVRKFDTPTLNDSAVPFLMYYSEILALLPFTTPDEPLYLIYAINRVVQVRAGALEANMKALSLQLSQEYAQKIPYENGINQPDTGSLPVYSRMASIDLNGTAQQDTDDQPHVVSSDAKMHCMESISNSGISEEDLQRIQADCLAAIALQLLLKLKRHLKIVYSIDKIRCQAFSPNEPLKPGEVLSKLNISFDIRETRTNMPTTYQELLQRYQEYKSALKEDTIDYSAYTANIKRKRPTLTPRKGRKPVQTIGRDDIDSDDNDDEDYTASGRKLSNSARKSSRSGKR